MADNMLEGCRDTFSKISAILNEIGKREDVTEFITTMQRVQITINQLIKNQRQYKGELLDDLQKSLKEYETLIVQLKETGKLLRFVTSNRLRRKIEQLNSVIHTKLELFRQSIKADPTKPTASLSPSGSRERGGSGNQSNFGMEDEEELEASLRLSLMIEDQDGKRVWEELYGLDVSDKFFTCKDQFLT
jgi:hypothetical protein